MVHTFLKPNTEEPNQNLIKPNRRTERPPLGRHEVPLERVNPSLIPAHLARESEWAKAEVVLHAASGCSRETHLKRGMLLERELIPIKVYHSNKYFMTSLSKACTQ